MFYIAVRDAGEINLKQLYMIIKKALMIRAFLLPRKYYLDLQKNNIARITSGPMFPIRLATPDGNAPELI